MVVTEIPYQVNKSQMIEKIAELVREKKIEKEISYIRDESSREGMRVVIEIKRDAVPDVVLNQLYRYSQLQSSFSVNNIALIGGRPEQLKSQGPAAGIHLLPRRSGHPADQVPAQEGAGPCPCLGGPSDRGGQYR